MVFKFVYSSTGSFVSYFRKLMNSIYTFTLDYVFNFYVTNIELVTYEFRTFDHKLRIIHL